MKADPAEGITKEAEALAEPAEHPYARPGWPPALTLPDTTTLLATLLCGLFLAAWGEYLGGGQRGLLLLYLAAAAGYLLLTLTLADKPAARAGFRARLKALLHPPRAAYPLIAGTVLTLALGLALRLRAWPDLLRSGDSPDYELAGRAAVALHHYYLIPWRTPGYPFSLYWTYRLTGIGNDAAVHAWQIAISLLTALAMMGAAYLLTGRRLPAYLALLVGCLFYPLAAASGFLMTEAQAAFLATFSIVLVLAVHRGRRVGLAMLGLGPILSLAYETRPQLAIWAGVAGLAALVARQAAWRHRVVLIAGAALTLAPVVAVNYQSAYHELTAAAPVDTVPQALGSDRLSFFWSAPNSPERLEEYRDGILADGAVTEYWITVPPNEQARATQAQMRTMLAWIRQHLPEYVQLAATRAPYFYRYDQPWDLTYVPNRAWLLLGDVLFALALVGLGTLLISRDRRLGIVLGGLVVLAGGAVALFHVEPRYSLPALPTIAVLGAAGAWWIADRLRAGGAIPTARALAPPAAVAVAVLLSVPASEVWLWPSLPDGYAPTPPTGTHQLASCSVGHHMFTSVAWRPGTSTVVAGGINGRATWQVGRGGCPWVPQNNVWDLAFTHDGRRLGVGAYVAGVVNPDSWVPEPGPPGTFLAGAGTDIISVSFDPSGRQLAYAAPGFHQVGLYDTTTHRVVQRAVLPGSPTSIRWSPDGSHIAVGIADGSLRLYDSRLSNLETAVRLDVPLALAWSPDGRTLAAGGSSGRISLWRLTGAEGGLVPGPAVSAGHGHVHAVAFSPDGTLLASAGADDRATVWDAASLRTERTLAGDTAPVWGLAWSPDSQRLVTAAADGSLKLWAGR